MEKKDQNFSLQHLSFVCHTWNIYKCSPIPGNLPCPEKILVARLITSIQRRWTNAISTLKFGWKWKLSRRMFIDVVSTLTKQRWNNIDRITSIQSRWPNVVSTLIVSWKWNLSQRMFIGVASALRKQHLNNFINCCTNVH